MCGIVGAFNTGEKPVPVNEAVLCQFEDQKSRGTQGFGIIKIDKKGKYKVDRSTEGYKFMWDIHQDPVTKMIMHHRTPTSTDNLMGQTHPMFIENGSLKYNYLVVHNGIIRNDRDLKKTHEALGFLYATEMEGVNGWKKFNDSEALAIELARYIENQTNLLEIEGSAAFIVLQIEKEKEKVEKMYFGRTGSSPLKMAKTRGKLFLSSEGQGASIVEDTLYSCKLDEDMKLQKVKLNVKPTRAVTTYPHGYESNYGGYHGGGSTASQASMGFSIPPKDSKTPTNPQSSYYMKDKRYDDEDNDIEPVGGSEDKLPHSGEIEFGTPEEEQFQELMDMHREELDSMVDEFFDTVCNDPDPEGLDVASYAYAMQEAMSKVLSVAIKARTQIQLAQDTIIEEAEKETQKELERTGTNGA